MNALKYLSNQVDHLINQDQQLQETALDSNVKGIDPQGHRTRRVRLLETVLRFLRPLLLFRPEEPKVDFSLLRTALTTSKIKTDDNEQCYSLSHSRSSSLPTSKSAAAGAEGKSPTSPSTPVIQLALFRRPLLSKNSPRKTLVLDLDETLIHSLSLSSKYSPGHMVEVKLNNQHATLYYVHKRPFCDAFLSLVAQWYDLAVFTASIQAYADPMIDWLEQGRNIFFRRFYRHHCTASAMGYVKDLSLCQQDLSKVIIIDNSPVSYSLHQENAISIEGWINDPSDHNLLNLLPFLNALRYSTDVRALLSLKFGEDGLQRYTQSLIRSALDHN